MDGKSVLREKCVRENICGRLILWCLKKTREWCILWLNNMNVITVAVTLLFNIRKKSTGSSLLPVRAVSGVFLDAACYETLLMTAKITENHVRFDNNMFIRCV